jgi:Zn-dependent peptidase ImmA (M78 family)
VNEQFEREANHFAAEVLFQGDRFDGDLRDLPLAMKSALALAKRYGASWRKVYQQKRRNAVIAKAATAREERAPQTDAP